MEFMTLLGLLTQKSAVRLKPVSLVIFSRHYETRIWHFSRSHSRRCYNENLRAKCRARFSDFLSRSIHL